VVATSKTGKGSRPWTPARQDIIWIDCNPRAGQEMRDVHPFLVLFPRNFNNTTSLVIGLPTDLVTRGGFAPRFLDISLFEGRISDFKLE